MIFGGRGIGAAQLRVVAGSSRSPPGGLPSHRVTRSSASAPPAITDIRSSKPGAAQPDQLHRRPARRAPVALSLNRDESQMISPELSVNASE